MASWMGSRVVLSFLPDMINNDLIPEILSASKINRLISVGKFYVNESRHCFQFDPKIYV